MPKSLENDVLSRQLISQGLVQSVRLVGEYRGKQALFKQQSPQVLERALPAVSRPTIARALRELSAEGVVRCVGRGRDATWEKTIQS